MRYRHLRGLVETPVRFVPLLDLLAQEAEDVVHLVEEEPPDEREVVNGAGLFVRGGVDDALGDLRRRHASGRQVFHQRAVYTRLPGEAVDALGPTPVQPTFDVLDDHANVAAGAFDGDRPLGHIDPNGVVVGVVRLGGRLPSRRAEPLEGVGGRLHVEDMGHPSAQEPLVRLPLLVCRDRDGGRGVYHVVA